MSTAKISRDGRVTIPKQMRIRMGLRTGDRVEFVEEPKGGFKIRAVKREVRFLKGLVLAPRGPYPSRR